MIEEILGAGVSEVASILSVCEASQTLFYFRDITPDTHNPKKVI